MMTEMPTTFNSETICSINCNHKMYGPGKITKIKYYEYLGKPDLFINFESATKSTVFAYTIASKFLEFDETDALTIENLMAEYTENWIEFDANRKAEAEAEYKAQKEAEAQAKADREIKRKLEAAMAKLNKMQPKDVSAICGNPQTEYETIGWLAKHCTSIKPSMPAEAQYWFESKFGKVSNAKIYEIGSKTSGGNAMKYTLSILGSFDAEVPAILHGFVSNKNLKQINSVEFFWTLNDRYGFQFGKKQDVDEIKKFVPDSYLPDFERGLSM